METINSRIISQLASHISTHPACMEVAPPPRTTTSSPSSRSMGKPIWPADSGPVDPIWSTSSWCCRLCRPVFPINHKTESRISSSRPSISRASASTSVRVHPPPGEWLSPRLPDTSHPTPQIPPRYLYISSILRLSISTWQPI